jgi:hypothetical protein
MRKLLSCGVVCLFVVAAMTLSGGQNHSAKEGIRGQFVGAWRLARLEQSGVDGKIQNTHSAGLLVFTDDGHMSVQIMEGNPQAQAAAGPEQYSQGGYEASFGTYQIDDSSHTFTFHVEGALVRSLVGKDLPRAFELSGKQLIVKSARPDEHWRVVWERY